MEGKQRFRFRSRGINRAAHVSACVASMEEIIFHVKTHIDSTHQFPKKKAQMRPSPAFFARSCRSVGIWTLDE